MELTLHDKLFIGGSFGSPKSGQMEAVINPATGNVLGEAPVGGDADIDAALEAARNSFDHGPWSRATARQRVEKMKIFYDYLLSHTEEIIPLIVAEAGATVTLARAGQFNVPMKHVRYALESAVQHSTTMALPELTPNAQGGKTLGAGVVVREPVGVVTAITAYNYPFMLNLVKVVPALLAGNSVILKPSPYTPFEALFLGDAARAAGLPDGVFNIVTGDKEASQRLTTDPRVDLITFTGSDTVGAAIMMQASQSLKRVVLELGGKSAMIVRADANLDRAVASGLGGFTSHCGQGCSMLTRHLVHNSIRDQYVTKLQAGARAIKVGDPTDPTTQMGPLIRDVQRKRVEHYVESALESGAKLMAGGRRPPGQDKGFFYEPTLFNDVDNSWPVAQDEIFGPVGVVIGFDTDEEAITLANASPFGLNAGIFSADTGRAYELALQLRTGGVILNGGPGTMLSDAPFGGIKRSGFGRENGPDGLAEFTYTKTIGFHAG